MEAHSSQEARCGGGGVRWIVRGRGGGGGTSYLPTVQLSARQSRFCLKGHTQAKNHQKIGDFILAS